MTDSKASPKGTSHYGHVAILGRPNVGKSTLLNHLLGEKISITSRKPQTTRHQVLGIYNDDGVQMIFVDTPGIHQADKGGQTKALNRYMNRTALQVIEDVDCVLWVVTAGQKTAEDDWIGQRLLKNDTPLIIALNKIDTCAQKQSLLPQLAELQATYNPQAIVPISALKNDNLAELVKVLKGFMPEGEAFFDEDQLTDRTLRFLAAERIREKLTRQLGDELPHELTVEIESFEEDETLARIHGLILVERASQKSIVIGKQGSRLKRVGSEARQELEHLIGKKVMLELWVRVKTGWSDDERALASLGYD